MNERCLAAWQALRGWLARHPRLGDVLVGVAFGALVEFVAVPFLFHDFSSVRKAGDNTVDQMIRLAQRIGGVPDATTPFVFVDIDDDTWSAWGSPLVTPRSKLADLIGHVADSEPALIFLDVDLGFPSGDPDGDAALKRRLVAPDAVNRAPLLLVRPLVDAKQGLPTTREPSFGLAQPPLGALNATGTSWVSAQFDKDGDGVVRRWRLFESVCGPAGGPATLPSVHLAATLLMLDKKQPGSADAAMAKLRALLPASCASPEQLRPAVTLHDGERDLTHGGGPIIATGADAVGNRIIYAVGWKDRAAALGPFVNRPAGAAAPLVSVRPASAILKLGQGEKIDGLSGRIVVIGGSYHDSGDWHATPLGRMPGALIVVNAIHTLLEHGTPGEPEGWRKHTLSFALVVAVALLFSVLRPFFAGLAATFLTLALLIVSVPWFKSGVVLDLAVPSVGVLLHNLMISATDLWRNFRAHGAGWMLHPKE